VSSILNSSYYNSLDSVAFFNIYISKNESQKNDLIHEIVFGRSKQWESAENISLVRKLLDDKRFQNFFTKNLKVSDLLIFIQIYSISMNYKMNENMVLQEAYTFKNQTNNKKLVKDIFKKGEFFFDIIKVSPIDISKIGIFINEKRFTDFLRFFIEGKKLAFIDEAMIEHRYNHLMHIVEGDVLLETFVNYLKDNNYISPIDCTYSTSTLYSRAYNYSKNFLKFNIFDLLNDYLNEIRDFLNAQETIRRDKFSHRTVFIKKNL
jgi:hypothetical protein